MIQLLLPTHACTPTSLNKRARARLRDEPKIAKDALRNDNTEAEEVFGEDQVTSQSKKEKMPDETKERLIDQEKSKTTNLTK